jgi:hypothetical protein
MESRIGNEPKDLRVMEASKAYLGYINQARLNLTAVQHTLGIWNSPQIPLQLIIAGQACQRPWRILVPARVFVA